MASIQQDPGGNFHVSFRLGGQRFKRSLKTRIHRKAEAAASRIEENIRLVQEGRLELPDDADIPVFLLSDGKLTNSPKVAKSITLGSLFETFVDSIPEDALEATSLYTIRTHARHFVRILGGERRLRSLKKPDLQQYVTQRSTEPGRHGTLSAVTIRKEIATLRALWNWAKTDDLVSGDFPNRGLVFPKAVEKPPFQTWEQLERQTLDNGLSVEESRPLWDCLYLNHNEVKTLLQFVKEHSRHRFLYPMCAIAAYTGARRSEICRSRTTDVDLNASTIAIRERKRSRSHRTTRTIPISGLLSSALETWLRDKPKSTFL